MYEHDPCECNWLKCARSFKRLSTVIQSLQPTNNNPVCLPRKLITEVQSCLLYLETFNINIGKRDLKTDIECYHLYVYLISRDRTSARQKA